MRWNSLQPIIAIIFAEGCTNPLNLTQMGVKEINVRLAGDRISMSVIFRGEFEIEIGEYNWIISICRYIARGLWALIISNKQCLSFVQYRIVLVQFFCTATEGTYHRQFEKCARFPISRLKAKTLSSFQSKRFKYAYIKKVHIPGS